MNPGAGIGRDIAKGEAVETEIDVFISRRDAERRKSEPERELEAVWRAFERIHEAARRREARAGWYSWHAHRAELYGRLSREHAATAEELLQDTDERRTA
jgi:hypothetical protein